VDAADAERRNLMGDDPMEESQWRQSDHQPMKGETQWQYRCSGGIYGLVRKPQYNKLLLSYTNKQNVLYLKNNNLIRKIYINKRAKMTTVFRLSSASSFELKSQPVSPFSRIKS
jgi:hypothetical protein